MNKLILMMLLGFSMVVLLIPFGKFDGNFAKADLFVSESQILLKSEDGVLALPLPNLDAPYLNLIDSSNIQRIELIPYGGKIVCNVMDGSGKRYSEEISLCLSLAIKFNKDLYVYPGLLQTQSLLEKEPELSL